MTPDQEQLLRRTITASLSDDEHQLYIRACERTGLDPFGRFLYVARDHGEFRVELTIDGFRLTAERTGRYLGQLGPQWCGSDGKWRNIWIEPEPPHAARVGILRVDFPKPIWGKAVYAEFVQDTEFWRKMPSNQIAKCAEAAGFRKAFPGEFGGLYAPEELPPVIAKRSGAVACTLPPEGDGLSQRIGNPQSTPRVSPSQVSGNPDSQPGPDAAPPTGPVLFPVRGDAPSGIPAPLQPFINAGMSRKNVNACWLFLRRELEAALGEAAGRKAFQQIWLRVPGVFRTREEARKRTIAAWCECWQILEAAKAERRAA